MLDPALGDCVWVDEDRDGIQDADEKGLEDVVLTIAGPDGNPVNRCLRQSG
ncbi:SdrD B-like domain-containing protein [Glutamicibacter soli]|uniref:SdrD B-like domain-containing protein n=1 Tax=Glutamicibacter soli TaxID=453836 RepID=UPI003FD0063B